MSEEFEKFFKEEYIREGFVWSKEHAEVFFNAGLDTRNERLEKKSSNFIDMSIANSTLTKKVEVLREALEDAEHLIAKTSYSEMFTHKKIKQALAEKE